MRRRARVLFPALFTLLLIPSIVTAQTRLFFGAGMTSPMGDYGDYAKTGWMTNLGLGFPLKNPKLSITAAGFYGSNSHSDVEGDKTNLYGLVGHLRYALHEANKTGLFLAGGGGFQVHKFSTDATGYTGDSETQAIGSLAAGLDIPLSKVGLYVVAGYILGDTSYLRFMAGLSIPLGGSK